MDRRSYDIIVVGLGAAGSMACATLCQNNRSVLALEADSRMGGRIHTKVFGDSIVELGAEWIHGSKNNALYQLATFKNIEIVSQVFKHYAFSSDGMSGDSALLGVLCKFVYSTLRESAPTQPLGQYITTRLTEFIDSDHPELANNPAFMEQFLRWMQLVICNHEACPDWLDVSTQSEYEELKGSPYHSWHKKGYKTLFNILINNKWLTNVEMSLNTEVENIKLPEEKDGEVQVTCVDGSVYYGRSVIVTVSLGVLKHRHTTMFTPPLPAKHVAAIENLSIGVVNKVILEFKDIWWPTDTYCIAFLWTAKDIADVLPEDLWTTNIFGASLSLANDKVLVFWMSGHDAILMEKLPSSEVKAKIMMVVRRFLSKYYTISEPIDMVRSSWNSDPFYRGSYSYDNVNTPWHPHSRMHLGEPVFDAHGNLRLMFAGEATNRHHFSTTHGALATGHREAMRFLRQHGYANGECSAPYNLFGL